MAASYPPSDCVDLDLENWSPGPRVKTSAPDPVAPVWAGMDLTPQAEERRRYVRSLSDPRGAAEEMRARTVSGLARNFERPVEITDQRTGRVTRFELMGDLEAEPAPDPYDYKAVHDALMAGRTYGFRVRGRFRVAEYDKEGKLIRTLDDRDIPVAKIPTPVYDRAFVVDGRKRHLTNQFRRRPGIFTLQDAKGTYVSEFNVDHGAGTALKNFRVWMDQGNQAGPEYYMAYGTAEKIPAWDVARLLGATEKDLERTLGGDAAAAIAGRATDARYERTIRQLYRSLFAGSASAGAANDGEEAGRGNLSLAEMEAAVRDQFRATRFDPTIMKLTMGMEQEALDKNVFLKSMAKIRAVANDEAAPDDRESLALKRVLTPADLLTEAVGRPAEINEFRKHIAGQLRKARAVAQKDPTKVDVRQVMGNRLAPKINARLTSSMLQRSDTGTNPLDAWAAASMTTIMGEGAIGSTNAIPVDAKLINPSTLAYLDPAHTPESDRAGINVHQTSRTRAVPDTTPSRGGPETGSSKLVSSYIDTRGREVELAPNEVVGKVIGFYDQKVMKNGRPVAKSGRVKAAINGSPVEVDPGQVDLWMPDPLSMFDVNTSLVPMSASAHGTRLQYASKQSQQAVPLVEREAPLVQVAIPGAKSSLEAMMGEEAGAVHAPVAGTVVDIVEGGPGERYVVLETEGGGRRRISLPKNLPMGGHTPLDSTVRVEKGQKVGKGDLLADSTFTDRGTLAIGTNLRTAYLPWHSATFEDAVAISESAAKKMTSTHLYEVAAESDQIRMGKQLYRALGAPLRREEMAKLDDNGVIKVGSWVKPGEPVAVGVKGISLGDRDVQEKLALLGMFGKKNRRELYGQTQPYMQTWKENFAGEVVAVEPIKSGKDITGFRVHVRTVEPMQAGDKIYGRHGNKGVVSTVMRDEEMPRLKNYVDVVDPGGSKYRVGQEISVAEAEEARKAHPNLVTKPATVDLLLNPLGIAGRLNPSQVHETYMGRIAHRNGAPIALENFGENNNWAFVKKQLEDAGLSEGEDLVDPATGKTIRNVGIGRQYILKAKQTVAAKNSARGLGVFQKNQLVARGEDGGKDLGELGVYGLLAADAREFLRDAQLYKSENREEIWRALREGKPIGDLGASVNSEPFAFERFKNYLRAAGVEPVEEVDPVNDRYVYRLQPLTDKRVVELSRSVVGSGDVRERVFSNPVETVEAQKGRPVTGGLFDPKITGGPTGRTWGRFELSQAIPNPMYERAIQDMLGLDKERFGRIMAGKEGVEVKGSVYYGAQAVEQMLANVDLADVRNQSFALAKNTSLRDSERSRAYRVLRSVDMLEKAKLTPTEAFMRKQVPVIPEIMRTIDVDEKGEVVVGDMNYLYRDLAMTDDALRKLRSQSSPASPTAVAHVEQGLYEAMRTLLQVQGSKPMSGEYQGPLGVLTGQRMQNGEKVGDVKASFFKDSVVSRRQAFSGGAVLAADDTLGIDQAAVPKTVMAGLLELDLEAEWRRQNPPPSRRDADYEKRETDFRRKVKDYQQLGRKDPEVDRLLHIVSKRRQIVVKRDPVLHQYGIQAFEPVLTDRNTLGLNPLVFGGFNADSDGDVLSLYVPLTEEANREAREKLRPSTKLFNPASGALEYTLGHESVLGIARATRNPRRTLDKSYASLEDAKKAWMKDEIEVDDGVKIAGKATTVGREMFSVLLPPGMTLESLIEDGVIKPAGLDVGVSKASGNLRNLLEHLAINHKDAYGPTADGLQKFGRAVATYSGASLTLSDLQPLLPELRAEKQRQLEGDLDKVARNRSLSPRQRQEEVEKVFAKAIGEINTEQSALWKQMVRQERPATLPELVFSGARANENQLKQMLVAPVAMVDGRGQVVPVPVMRNYSEGLDASSYWTAMHGARMGAVSKVIQVREPGYLTKQLVNTSIDQVVTERDCGTDRFREINANDRYGERDLVGRVLASSTTVGGLNLGKGHVLSLNDVSEMKRQLKGDEPLMLRVRSSLSCEAKSGVCQKCAGFDTSGQPYKIGTNVGIIAAQALGERSTQLTLSTFHGGGVFTPGTTSAGNLYAQAQALFRMPSTMGGQAAVVAKSDATVKEVKENPIKGGWDLVTEEDDAPNYFIPRHYKAPWEVRAAGVDRPPEIPDYYRPGMPIRRGDILTNGVANPKDIMAATGDITKVQDYLAGRLNDLFRREGIQRRNVEMLVKSMTENVEVTDPGGAPFLPGQRIPRQQAERIRRDFPDLKFRAVLRGIDIAPREMREDFMSRLNFNNLHTVLSESAQIGAESNFHGHNPIPALAVGKGFNRAPRRLREQGVY